MSTAQKITGPAGDRIQVVSEYRYKDAIKAIPGARWDPVRKAWLLPYTAEVWQDLMFSVPGLSPDEAITEELMPEPEDINLEVPPHPPLPLRSGIRPYKHQEAAFAFALQEYQHGTGYALLMEMGTGKSLTAVAIAGQLYRDGKIKRVLVVAPLAVVPVWPSELADYAGFPYHIETLEGDKKKRLKALQRLTEDKSDALKIAVINYESSWRLKSELAAWAPQMIICDESQRIKEPGSAQSKGMHELAEGSRYRLILTGTPVTNSPLDFFSQYKFLDPGIFGKSWYAFKAKYAVEGQGINHATGKTYNQVVGYRNLAELTEKAHAIAYRVTKKQALDLPEEIDQKLFCELEPEARKAYDQLKRDAIAEIDGLPAVTAQHIIVRLLRLSQICGGYIKTDVDGYEDDPKAGKLVKISKAKWELLQDTLKDILEVPGKKVVIFARFTAEIRDIVGLCQTLYGPDSYRLIDGSIPAAERGPAVEAFQKDPRVRIFIAQIQTAGLGITLTAADTAIFYSFDYSYANYEQAKARIHRIGQRHPVNYIHLIARGTVDEEVLAALQHKRDVAAICVDRWREIIK
jgi:SNF2 family DNA or RNA helicase